DQIDGSSAARAQAGQVHWIGSEAAAQIKIVSVQTERVISGGSRQIAYSWRPKRVNRSTARRADFRQAAADFYANCFKSTRGIQIRTAEGQSIDRCAAARINTGIPSHIERAVQAI